MNPWLILGTLLAILAAAGVGYGKGRTDGTAACNTRVAAMVKAGQDAKDNEAAVADRAADKVEKGDAKAKVIYRNITRTVDKIVDRPVYRNVCLDADGVRSVNAALSGAPPDPGKPGAALP